MIRGEAGSSDVFVHFLSQKLMDRISHLFSGSQRGKDGKLAALQTPQGSVPRGW